MSGAEGTRSENEEGPWGSSMTLGFCQHKGGSQWNVLRLLAPKTAPGGPKSLYFFPFAGPVLWNQGWPGPPNWWCVGCKTCSLPLGLLDALCGKPATTSGGHSSSLCRGPPEAEPAGLFFFSNFILILLLEFGKKPCDCIKLML